MRRQIPASILFSIVLLGSVLYAPPVEAAGLSSIPATIGGYFVDAINFVAALFEISPASVQPQPAAAAAGQGDTTAPDITILSSGGISPSTSGATTAQLVSEPIPPALTVSTTGSVTQAQLREGLGQLAFALTSALAALPSAVPATTLTATTESTPHGYSDSHVRSSSHRTFKNLTVNGVTGIKASDLPSLSGSYLSTSGGTVSGSTTVADLLPGTAGVLKQTVVTPVAANSDGFYNDQQKQIAVGSDGFVRFIYFSNGYTDLHLVQCRDADCATKNDTLVATDSNGVDEPTIVMDGNLARIAYIVYEPGTQQRFIQCEDEDCQTKTDNLVDYDTGGYEQSFALGTDGKARIVYNDYTANEIRFALCADEACASVATSTISHSTDGNAFGIAVASDGNARIAYSGGGELNFLQCQSADCASSTVTDVVSDDNGYYVDMVLSGDNKGRIVVGAYFDGFQYVQCTDAACSMYTLTTLDPGFANSLTSIVLGTDGLPRTLYTLTGSGGTLYAQCANADCTARNTATIATTGGYPTSIALGTDGFARIIYGSSDDTTLYLARLESDDGVTSASGSSLGSSDTPFGGIYGKQVNSRVLNAESLTITHDATFATSSLNISGGCLMIANVCAIGVSNPTFPNIFGGNDALSSNTTGANNVAFGLEAMKSNTTGSDNVAIGWQTLPAYTTVSTPRLLVSKPSTRLLQGLVTPASAPVPARILSPATTTSQSV